MKLINFKNSQIEITDEALFCKPIRDLYEADKSKGKVDFLQQCSVIYFMCDPRSMYFEIPNEEDRIAEIKKGEGIEFTIDKTLRLAMDYYTKSCETASSRLLKSSKVAAQKISEFLENVDLYAEDDKGRPKYDPAKIASTIAYASKISKDLTEQQKTVDKELEEKARIRGGSDNLSLFEDGI